MGNEIRDNLINNIREATENISTDILFEELIVNYFSTEELKEYLEYLRKNYDLKEEE